MPAKPKSTANNKAAKSQRRVPIWAPPTDIDLRGAESALVARHEPVVTLSHAEAPRPVSVEAMDKAIAKEDAKIIAKASARAIRRGLH